MIVSTGKPLFVVDAADRVAHTLRLRRCGIYRMWRRPTPIPPGRPVGCQSPGSGQPIRFTDTPVRACGIVRPARRSRQTSAIRPSMLSRSPQIGIAAIAVHEPRWVVNNDWFGDTLPPKFVRHTGIESRRISDDDEVVMAMRAFGNLRSQIGLRISDCAGVVFVASSLLPVEFRQKYRGAGVALGESLHGAARRFIRRAGLQPTAMAAINWGCSGYAKAMTVACRDMLPRIELGKNQFILLVTVNRTSGILDFACKQTAGLFGDFAQITVLARGDSDRYPVHFNVVGASADVCPADGVFFEYHWRENVPVPKCGGGRQTLPRRLVFSLNGMGIGDAAPRAMADAAQRMLQSAQIDPKEVRFVVPHQAGAGIVRLAAMQLERIGVAGELVNGLTRELGNISSSSVPYALRHHWARLDGLVLCPTAGVGNPGEPTVTCGCVLLRATEHHHTACASQHSDDLPSESAISTAYTASVLTEQPVTYHRVES